jgi:hypothetical protein
LRGLAGTVRFVTPESELPLPDIEATEPSVDPVTGGGDKSLPDASSKARLALALPLVLAVVVAVAMNVAGWTNDPFTPPEGDFNFALFAGFYVGAQVIERLMELVAPVRPPGHQAARRVKPKWLTSRPIEPS